jgi:hypothetical protein
VLILNLVEFVGSLPFESTKGSDKVEIIRLDDTREIMGVSFICKTKIKLRPKYPNLRYNKNNNKKQAKESKTHY